MPSIVLFEKYYSTAGMAMLLAILVLLLHILVITWLRQSMDSIKENNAPLPFKLEVSLQMGKENPKPNEQTPQPQTQPKSETKPQPKAKPKSEKNPPPTFDKLPDLGEIEQLIKSKSVKEIDKNIKYSSDRQSAQAVSSKMVVMPPKGGALAKDNFPPSLLHNPSPEYPEMTIFLGYQGASVVRIKVSAAGLSDGVDVLRSSGFDMLDKSTVQALKKWRFTPQHKR